MVRDAFSVDVSGALSGLSVGNGSCTEYNGIAKIRSFRRRRQRMERRQRALGARPDGAPALCGELEPPTLTYTLSLPSHPMLAIHWLTQVEFAVRTLQGEDEVVVYILLVLHTCRYSHT